MSIKQTKGYLSISGKVKFMSEKSLKVKPRSKEVLFAVETKEGNIINVKAFGWNKEDDDMIYVALKDGGSEPVAYADRFFLDEGKTIIGTSIKQTKDGEVTIMVDVDAVDLIYSTFKNGDSVFINAQSEVDTYFKDIKWIVNKIYASSSDINFEDKDFQEENHGKQWIAFESISDGKLKGFIISKKEEVFNVEFELDSEYITDEDFKKYQKGDLVQVDFECVRTAQYKEVEAKEQPQKFKGKGKYAKAQTQQGTYKSITGFDEKFVCVGISNEKIGEIQGDDLKKLGEDDDSPF